MSGCVPPLVTTTANSLSQSTSQAGASSNLCSPVQSRTLRPSSTNAPSTTPFGSYLNSCINYVFISHLVTDVRGSSPVWTSTVTTQTFKTLSPPDVFSTTDTNGGQYITTPPLVTIMSTFNSSFTIVTHVVATPTSSGQQLTTTKSSKFPCQKCQCLLMLLLISIMQNQGAVAGIFVTVGIVLAFAFVGFIYCLKRNQRIARRKRWLVSLRQQPSILHLENPFEGPDDQKIDTGITPIRRSLDFLHNDTLYDSSGVGTLLENLVNHEHPSTNHEGGLSLLNPDEHPMSTPAYPGSTDADGHHNVGIAYSIDPPAKTPRYRHSTTLLTPDTSSLLSLGNDFLRGRSFFRGTQQPESVSNVPPPRPPRSHLRESAKHLISITPESASSHTYAKDRNPTSVVRPQDVLSRRTILDVRAPSCPAF